MSNFHHIDLFSGIGGFALAARWAGIETVQFVEIDKFCQKVLAKNFPGVPIHDDIKTFKWAGDSPFILTGGFPCQDLSYAGKCRGLHDGTRSGLWSEYYRIVSEIRPKYIVVENVAGLLTNHALGRVLGDLAEIGYDAEWNIISAESVGAPHIRERVWIVAYPRGELRFDRSVLKRNIKKVDWWDNGKEKWGINRIFPKMGTKTLSRLVDEQPERFCNPELLRISHGIPDQLDRLKSLGNAIVPQVAYEIMKAIKQQVRKSV